MDTKRMRFAAKAIYLAVDSKVADDVSKMLIEAADELDRLPATAPELLEACKVAYDWIIGNRGDCSWDKLMKLLRGAIKKAEGCNG